jgi:hypothetical protein
MLLGVGLALIIHLQVRLPRAPGRQNVHVIEFPILLCCFHARVQ